MIALSVVKKDAEMLSMQCWLKLEVLPKKRFWGLKWGTTDRGNLSTDLSRRFHMCDPCNKFKEDRTKIVVAIVDESFVRTHTHTHTHIDTQTYTQVILLYLVSVQCHELHWTDKKTRTDDRQ